MSHAVFATVFANCCLVFVLRSYASLSCVFSRIRPLISASLISTSSASTFLKSAVYNTYGGIRVLSSSFSPFQAVAMVTFWIRFQRFIWPLHDAKCDCVSLTLSWHTWHSVVVYISGLLLLSSSEIRSLSIMHFINAHLLVLLLLVMQCTSLVVFSLFQNCV